MKNNKKKIIIFFITIILFILTVETIQYIRINYRQNSVRSWVLMEPKFTPDFYKTREAKRIGKNVMYFQTGIGGWSKDIAMQNRIYYIDKMLYRHKKGLWYPTIDNDATVTEIDYLSKLYNATKDECYKIAVLKGMEYLLEMQYSNGGFPQKYPIAKMEYQKQITFNDNAMVNVMKLLKKITENDKQYNFIDSEMREKIKSSYNKGLKFILSAQLPSGMWGAQYDRRTLVPCSARKYEPASIDTRESASITIFLMSINNPSPEVVNAIEKSVNWYKTNAIKNKTLKKTYKNCKPVLELVDCDSCDLIWTRLHDLDKGIPIFSDRNGEIKYNMSDVSRERMFGYEWYVDSGNDVLREYEIWKKR